MTGIISLCPDCHSVKHYGFACVNGNEDYVYAHFSMINGLSEEKGAELVRNYFDQWEQRSRFSDWKADLSWINSITKVENYLLE